MHSNVYTKARKTRDAGGGVCAKKFPAVPEIRNGRLEGGKRAKGLFSVNTTAICILVVYTTDIQGKAVVKGLVFLVPCCCMQLPARVPSIVFA